VSLAANLARIREEIAQACRRAGRAESEVALMAVGKMHPAGAIAEAWAAGLRLFGENRVQEWQEKSVTVGQLEGAAFHLIGPLQSNKAARAAELFDAIDSVDSLKIAARLNAAALVLGKRLPILIEVKLSHEESKHGVAPAELPALLVALAPLEALIPLGLMTVPPWPADLANAGEEARPYFRELRRLRDASLAACPTLTQLSMGMSNDFSVAIEEGSTCVRIGTALFGKRVPSSNAAP
jgi:pyridoxal phosphate enzyme (YggS family)